jgi:hypothetical protein
MNVDAGNCFQWLCEHFVSGPDTGISDVVNSTLIDLCFIAEEYAMKNSAIYKHLPANLKTKP